MNPSSVDVREEIVVPIAKDEYNFLKTFFLATHDELLKEPDINNNGIFGEFGGINFMDISRYRSTLLPPGGKRLSRQQNSLIERREKFIGDLNRSIHFQGGETYNQNLPKYQNNDHILYDFCANQDDTSANKYVFLIRNKDEPNFRLPEGPNGQVFVPVPVPNEQNIIIVFLEVEVAEGGEHYYNLIVAKNTTNQRDYYPYCTRYVIKQGSAGTLGCNLVNMSKRQQVIDAIDEEIEKNGQNTDQLTAFKNVVSAGLSLQQSERTRANANLDENIGPPTPSVSGASSDSSYTPSVNERVNNTFAGLPSFTQTLVPGENVCADKMIIEMLKSNNKRSSLFSGGRRYKKSTQRNLVKQRNKTKRRHMYKNV